MSVIPFPTQVSSQCSSRTMPGLTTPELRARAVENFYSAERRLGVDPITAHDRAEAFGRDLDVIAQLLGGK